MFHWVPSDTPYNVNELAEARRTFTQCLNGNPSKALISLKRKSSLAINGPSGFENKLPFHNNYFTNLEQDYVEIPEAEYPEPQDINHQIGSPENSDIKEIRQDTVDEGPVQTTQSNHPAKRKIDSSKEADVVEEPIKKKRYDPKEHNVVGDEGLRLYWRCDYCQALMHQRPLIENHLKSAGHYSASLTRCRSVGKDIIPLCIVSPVAIVEPSSFGKNLLAVCPHTDCKKVFHDTYECSFHFTRSHNSPYIMNRYSLGSVLLQDEVVFYPGKACNCGKVFQAVQDLAKHSQNCVKFPGNASLKHSFMVYLCSLCNEFFSDLSRATSHRFRCVNGNKKEVRLQMFQVKKPAGWKVHLPNTYSEVNLQKEIINLEKDLQSSMCAPNKAHLKIKIKQAQELKKQFHSFMQFRYEHYDKEEIIVISD